ncbi:hypothetical protein ACOMHN_033784 [Nucella lapillus]
MDRENIIKGLLNDSVYDSRIPPNYEDNFPTNVTIQVFILSFDSVKEASMVTYESGQSPNLPYTATTGSGYEPPRFVMTHPFPFLPFACKYAP